MKKSSNTGGYLHILKYTGLFGGVQGLSVLVGVIRNKLVAMLLGPEGMGLLSLFNSTIKLISDSTSFGLSMSAVRNISEDFDKGDNRKLTEDISLVRSWSILTALFGFLVCIFFSPFLSGVTFSWKGHTLHFILLSPAVALIAVTSGELAILKGTRKLHQLASVSVCNMVAVLMLSVPLYYFFRNAAVVPSLVLMALVQMILTVAVSYRLFTPHFSFSKSFLAKGIGVIRLGLAFVMAGILGSGADFVIRSYLSNVAGVETVGLYNAGYMMTMTYAGMVFSAMESDFFPRLSGANGLQFTFNQLVNRQVEVILLLISPLLVLFLLFLPHLLPLLYTGKFLPVLGMMQVLVLAVYIRALRLPVEYIPLAKGDSVSYLILESFYDILLVSLIIYGFNEAGLTGVGIGITVAGVADLLAVFLYTNHCYGYRVSGSVILYAAIQIPIGLVAYLCVQSSDKWIYWGGGTLLTVISLWFSMYIIKSKTGLWDALTNKLRCKFSRHAKN